MKRRDFLKFGAVAPLAPAIVPFAKAKEVEPEEPKIYMGGWMDMAPQPTLDTVEPIVIPHSREILLGGLTSARAVYSAVADALDDFWYMDMEMPIQLVTLDQLWLHDDWRIGPHYYAYFSWNTPTRSFMHVTTIGRVEEKAAIIVEVIGNGETYTYEQHHRHIDYALETTGMKSLRVYAKSEWPSSVNIREIPEGTPAFRNYIPIVCPS